MNEDYPIWQWPRWVSVGENFPEPPEHPGSAGTNPALSIPPAMQPGTVEQDGGDIVDDYAEDLRQLADYESKHMDCPLCGELMLLYGDKWVCSCGHREGCCD